MAGQAHASPKPQAHVRAASPPITHPFVSRNVTQLLLMSIHRPEASIHGPLLAWWCQHCVVAEWKRVLPRQNLKASEFIHRVEQINHSGATLKGPCARPGQGLVRGGRFGGGSPGRAGFFFTQNPAWPDASPRRRASPSRHVLVSQINRSQSQIVRARVSRQTGLLVTGGQCPGERLRSLTCLIHRHHVGCYFISRRPIIAPGDQIPSCWGSFHHLQGTAEQNSRDVGRTVAGRIRAEEFRGLGDLPSAAPAALTVHFPEISNTQPLPDCH